MVRESISNKDYKENRLYSSIKKSIHIFAYSIILLMIILTSLARPCFALENSITFTDDEKVFIEAHPIIILGVDSEFLPFEFIDENNEYKGIAVDYLTLISERTGLQFEVVKGKIWPEAYDMALAKEIDALPAIGKTSEREENLLFSKPYYYFKSVIVIINSDTNISGINILEGFTVAVQRNSSHHSYLLSYPKINLSLYDSVEAAIRSNGLTNLRFVSFEAEKSQSLYFATRKDWPELISIFNKAMNTIIPSEKQVINNKWIDLKSDIDFTPIVRALFIVGGIIVLVMGVSFFWIAGLRKEIRQRKQIQLDLEKAKYEAEKQLYIII